MSLLIVGGLLVIGLLALIGAVLLSLGEKPDKGKAARGEVRNATEEREKAPLTKQLEDEKSADVDVAAQPVMLNGQVHELASGLQALHEQTLEIEKQLSLLTEVAEHLEEAQIRRVSVEEKQESVR